MEEKLGLNLSKLLLFRAPALEPSNYIRLRLVSECFSTFYCSIKHFGDVNSL